MGTFKHDGKMDLREQEHYVIDRKGAATKLFVPCAHSFFFFSLEENVFGLNNLAGLKRTLREHQRRN